MSLFQILKNKFLYFEENMKYWRRFFECQCHGEGIAMSYEEDESNPTAYLAFFKFGLGKTDLRLRDKLRYCWHLFRTGKPFEDEICLSQETASELSKELFRFSRQIPKNKEGGNNG